MSQLKVSAWGQPDFYLNVTSFDSPIVGEMNSAQTRSQVQYFPIKAFQPELVCDVIFPNERQWQQWQDWVRQHMLNTQAINFIPSTAGVTLNWPRRSIAGWTAIIPNAKAGGMRANYTPRVRVEFQLCRSLVSELTNFFSFGTNWQGLFMNGFNLNTVNNLPANFQGGAVLPGVAGGGRSAIGNGLGSMIPGISTIGNGFASLIPGL